MALFSPHFLSRPPQAPVEDKGQVDGCQTNQQWEIDFIHNMAVLESGGKE